MSVHGVGPSVEFVPPPSQSATTRTTPDSGLGNDDRAMRIPPPGFNMSHPMYAPPLAPGPAENYSNPPNDYKPYQGGTVYFNNDYNRMPMSRGQQNMPSNYADENYGSPQAQCDYQSNSNPSGFANGVPMPQHPSTAMLSQSASMHQQPGYYWDNHAMNTPRQSLPAANNVMTGAYDGEMAMTPQQNQQYLAQHNFHQPPPITPTPVYQQQQQHSFMMPNGHPGTSPLMVQQVPLFLQHGYPPQMVQNPAGMYPHQMYLPSAGAQLMLRQGGRGQEQQQYLPHPAVVQQHYYPFPPPMVNPMINGPVMGFQPTGYNNRYKNGRRGGFGQYNGRHGRQTPNGSVPSESRSESVRSDMNVVNEGTEDIVEGVTEMQIKESTGERESSPSTPTEYKLRQKPNKQLLQLASGVKPERTTPSPPLKTESSSVDEKTTPIVEQEQVPSEPKPMRNFGTAPPEKTGTGCYHCKNKHKPDWEEHNFKEQQKVVCEDAKRTMHCSFCGNVGGENAHTRASCPKNQQPASSTPRDRSTESYQGAPRPRGLMDQATSPPYEKSYHSRGGNNQYRNYGGYNNRDRHGGYQRDGNRGRGGYSTRGQRSRGGPYHGKSDRGGAYHSTGSSGVA